MTWDFWTEKRERILREKFAEGLSYSQIAKVIGQGCTRNAALGRAKRLGLVRGSETARLNARSAHHRQPMRPKPARPAPKPKPQLIITGGHVAEKPPGHEPLVAIPQRAWEPLPGSNPKPWTERRFGECNWPIGEGLSCCEPVHKRGWCTAHFERGTQPMASSKPRSSNELMRSLRRYVA